MAHAAKIDENGIVREVLVVDNDKLFDGGKFTTKGEKSLNTYLHGCGIDGDWKLTSYNNKFRGRYAGQGFTYDPELDEFIAPEKNGIEEEDIIEEEDPNA